MNDDSDELPNEQRTLEVNNALASLASIASLCEEVGFEVAISVLNVNRADFDLVYDLLSKDEAGILVNIGTNCQMWRTMFHETIPVFTTEPPLGSKKSLALEKESMGHREQSVPRLHLTSEGRRFILETVLDLFLHVGQLCKYLGIQVSISMLNMERDDFDAIFDPVNDEEEGFVVETVRGFPVWMKRHSEQVTVFTRMPPSSIE